MQFVAYLLPNALLQLIVFMAGDIWGYLVDCTRVQTLSSHSEERSHFLTVQTDPHFLTRTGKATLPCEHVVNQCSEIASVSLGT